MDHVLIGELCRAYCGVELPLQVLQSAAGYYLGCWDALEGPMSRESVEYFPTQAAAEEAMRTGSWTQRSHP